MGHYNFEGRPKVRLTYLSTAGIPSYAANGVQTFQMCAAFARQTESLQLICLAPEAELRGQDPFSFYGAREHFDIHCLSRRHVSLARARTIPFALALKARSNGADGIYTRDVRTCFFATMMGIPSALELHSMDKLRGAFDRQAFRRLLASEALQGVVVISDALRQDVVDAFPHAQAVTIVEHDAAVPVPSHTEPLDLHPRSARQRQERAALVVGYVGGLYPGKGFEFIVQLARLAPWADFHVAGRHNRLLDEQLGSLPGNLQLHGFLQPADGDRFRIACDVLLAPYSSVVATHGGKGDIARWMSPLKIFEYMAAGRAMVVSDLPVLNEILTPNETAILAPVNDVDAWRKALELLREDYVTRNRLGALALQRFLATHTYEARARRLLTQLF